MFTLIFLVCLFIVIYLPPVALILGLGFAIGLHFWRAWQAA